MVAVSLSARALLNSMIVTIVSLSFAAVSLGSVAESAKPDQVSPHYVVERVTEDVIGLVKDNSELLKQNPQEFYRLIGGALQDIVAFDYIARGVMGSYAKQSTADQRQRFSEQFQHDLVTTYAKGMVSFSDYTIEVVPPSEDISGQRRVSVVQNVSSADGANTVLYTMGKSKTSGSWKLLNVVINGVNLGTTFRSQFAQSMKKHGGDLEAGMNNWSTKG